MMTWVSLLEKLTLEQRSERWEKKADEHLGRAIQKTEMGSGEALKWEHAERSKEEQGGHRGGRGVSRERGQRHEGREVTGEHGGTSKDACCWRALCRGMLWCDLCFCFKFYFIWLCWVLVVACGVEPADQGWNPSPLHWECRVLATGAPGQSVAYVLKARSGCCTEMRLQGRKGRSREMCQETIMREREAGSLGQDNSRAWRGESGQILDRSYFIMKIFKHCESRDSDAENPHKSITPILLPWKSHRRRRLVGCSPGGREELDMTERLHFHFSLSCIGEGNGNPLQYSCLENPRDGGAWWAAISGIAQSQTRLQRLSRSSHLFLVQFYFLKCFKAKCIHHIISIISLPHSPGNTHIFKNMDISGMWPKWRSRQTLSSFPQAPKSQLLMMQLQWESTEHY